MNSVNLVGKLNSKPEITLSSSNNRVCTFLLNVRNSRGKYCNIKCIAMNEFAEQMYTRTLQNMIIGVKGEIFVDMKQSPLQDQEDKFQTVVWINGIETYKNNIIKRGE